MYTHLVGWCSNQVHLSSSNKCYITVLNYLLCYRIEMYLLYLSHWCKCSYLHSLILIIQIIEQLVGLVRLNVYNLTCIESCIQHSHCMSHNSSFLCSHLTAVVTWIVTVHIQSTDTCSHVISCSRQITSCTRWM